GPAFPPSVPAPQKPAYEAASTSPEPASTARRDRRASHTTAATWVVITSTVFATNIAADHDGEACSRVTTRAGSATSRTAKHRAYGRLATPRRVSRRVGPAPGRLAGAPESGGSGGASERGPGSGSGTREAPA